jgi:hypothetical protein
MTKEVNFDEIKFRASSWGNLLAESKTKGEPIGATCAKELVKIYAQEIYGRRKEILTSAMEKGKMLQAQGIAMVSVLEGELYMENEDQLEDSYFSGKPDMYTGRSIIDADKVGELKNSWELESFLPKLMEKPDASHVAQLNCYYSLSGAQDGAIFYTLQSCPHGILEQEKRKLLYQMDVATELNPEYVKAAEQLEKLLTFPDINIEERCIKIKIDRDESLIDRMKQKVPLMREWLHNFHKKHLSLYPKHELV